MNNLHTVKACIYNCLYNQ